MKKKQAKPLLKAESKKAKKPARGSRSKPVIHQEALEIQGFRRIAPLSIALPREAMKQGVENLNQLLADTMTIKDMYKKHHWQVAGSSFHQLHLLYDKHYDEQNDLVDTLAERVQTLGGIS